MSESPVFTIGLDVGGTKVAAGFVEFPSGRVVARLRSPSHAHLGGAQVLDTCVRMADELLGMAREKNIRIAGIGMGVPEAVDRTGNITSSEVIDWRNEDPHARFTGYPTLTIDSDARAGALAESLLGRGQNYKHSFLYVTVGTGISHTLVMNGQPYAGARGNAIVSASSPQPPCFVCGKSTATTLEQFAAGPALVRRYAEAGGQAHSGEEVLAAAVNGDARAQTVVTSAAEALAGGVAALINALDPEAVVVGGGLGTATGPYWDHFLGNVRKYIWAADTRNLPISQSGLGAEAGLLGAAALPLLAVNT